MFLFQNLCHQGVRKLQVSLLRRLRRSLLRQKFWFYHCLFWIGYSGVILPFKIAEGKWLFVELHSVLIGFQAFTATVMLRMARRERDRKLDDALYKLKLKHYLE